MFFSRRGSEKHVVQTHHLSFEEHIDALNKDILTSIKARGLCAPASLRGAGSLTNKTFQTAATSASLCVNYLNLENASERERLLALQTALYEEYYGVYGILVERPFPFQRKSHDALFKEELEARLMSSIVFILSPPTIWPHSALLPGAERNTKTEVAYYELGLTYNSSDGFSQTRGRSLVSGKSLPYTNRVTEIKTEKPFHSSDILTILTPEHLYESVREILPETCVTSVPSRAVELNKLPEMLSICHNESLQCSVTVNAPDFETALLGLRNKKFSIHALRLHTPCDLTVRAVSNVEAKRDVVEQVNGTVMVQYDDGSGFVCMSKRHAQSKAPILKRIMHGPFALVEQLRSEQEVFRGLQGIQPVNTKNVHCYALSPIQVSLLERCGVRMYPTKYYHAINYPTEMHELVERIVTSPKQISEDAASTIQAAYRGFSARRVVGLYREKEAALKQAENEFQEASAKLSRLTT